MVKTKGKRATVFKSEATPVLRDHIAGMVNPFADEAQGSKIHDANASKTFAYTERTYHTVLAGGNEEGYTVFFPSIKNCNGGVDVGTDAFLSGGTIGASATFTYQDADNYSSIVASCHKYRIVSWGLRVTCLSDAFKAKGRLMVREMEQIDLLQNTVVDSYTDNTIIVPITHDMDITVVPNHIGDQHHMFRDPSTTFNTLDVDVAAQPPYRCVGLYISGTEAIATATTQAILAVELVYNIECLPLTNTIGARLASPPAPHSHAIIEAVNNTRTATPLVNQTKSVWGTIKSMAGNALRMGANYALGKAGGMLSDFIQGKPSFPQIAYQASRPLLGN